MAFGLSPLRGKDLSMTRGEQTAMIFEILFWHQCQGPEL